MWCSGRVCQICTDTHASSYLSHGAQQLLPRSTCSTIWYQRQI